MHEWVDHTAELELRVCAETPEAVIDDATRAMGELLGEPAGEPVTHALEVSAGDRPGLLAAWLEELVFLSEHDQLIPAGAEAIDLGDGALRGEVLARRGRPSYLVKAITYHRLSFEPAGDGWRASVVLDV